MHFVVLAAFLVTFGLGVVYGAAAVFFQIRPVGFLYLLKNTLINLQAPTDAESRYLRWAFSDPLPHDIPLRYQPVNSMEELTQRLNETRTVPLAAFFEAYADLVTGQPARITEHILELPYRTSHLGASAFAYLSPSESNPDCGVLLIPESCHNKSSDALRHNGFGLSSVCDVYILIKPNHDYRALHNGRGKLRREMFVVGLLRRGSSYSVIYLVEALAWVSYLESEYPIFGIAGLSQGGEAALLVSLQAEPDFAVIASGFSVLQWRVTMAELDQIIIPGLYKIYSLSRIRDIIKNQGTYYLFSYGLEEHLFYGYDASKGESCTFLKEIDSKQIKCIIHGEGHVMPTRHVLEFIHKVKNEWGGD